MNYVEYFAEAKKVWKQENNPTDKMIDILKLDCLPLKVLDVEKEASLVNTWFNKNHITNALSQYYSKKIDLSRIAKQIVPDVELLYGCHLYVDKTYIYRSYYQPTKQTSWLWHYDNNPKSVLKIMIYLTDVDETQAPFQYVSGDLNEPSRNGPDDWGPPTNGSRIPDSYVDLKEVKSVVGPKGFSFIQNPNCTHRATVPEDGKTRDILVLRVRPIVKTVPYITKKFTTGIQTSDTVPIDPLALKITRPNGKWLEEQAKISEKKKMK